MGIRERCLKLCLACALLGGMVGSHSAEDPPSQPVIGLYNGAVAVGLELDAGSPLWLTNPQAMTDASLKDVLARVEELTQLQVHVDWQSLTDAGLDVALDTIIPEWSAGESIRQLVERIPGHQKHELTWVVEDKLISLMTAERAGEKYTTTRYYVGDLLSKDFSEDELIGILQDQTMGPWSEDEPGTGTITPFGNHLFVRQTFRNQQEVQGLLEALRRSEPIVLIGRSPEDLRLLRLYEDKLVSFDWPQIPLAEFAKRLTEMTGANFRLDQQTLTDAGLDADTLIDAKAKNLPLSRALELNLSNVNGSYLMIVIEDGVFKITSGEKASERYETILYNLGSLGITGERLEEFVTLLEAETSGPWEVDEPGTGSISVYPNRSSLLVRQTPNVQREILDLLRDLRTLPKDEPLFPSTKDGDKQVRTKYYSMAPETAEALAKLIPESIAKGTWELDDLQATTPPHTNPGSPLPIAPKPERLPGCISVVEIPERTTEIYAVDMGLGQDPVIQLEIHPFDGSKQVDKVVPAECYLAITHTPEVHAAIVKLLNALFQIPPRPAGGQHNSGGGGFFGIPARD